MARFPDKVAVYVGAAQIGNWPESEVRNLLSSTRRWLTWSGRSFSDYHVLSWRHPRLSLVLPSIATVR
jgi:hypothetical protein